MQRDDKGSLFRRDTAGRWVDGATPERHSVDAVYASGDRLWITCTHQDRNVTLVMSNRAVTNPIELDAERLPVDPSAIGTPELDEVTIDVPSVSTIPAGPGTPACTSLVLWLGPAVTAELLAALRTIPEARDLELLQVMGMAPGQIVHPGRGNPFIAVQSSGRPRPAIALVPPSFAQGRIIERALTAALRSAANVRLLCAVPRVTKKLGPASRER